LSLSINNQSYDSFHFVGILGIGMSAIAQFLVKENRISGSDRGCGAESVQFVELNLRGIGCEISPQDGSGVNDTIGAIVISTAIEESNPDLVRARELNIPVLHRSEILAAIVNSYRTISVTGTSGKSSVSAMIFHTLRESGIDASYIGGANLHTLRDQGFVGNGYRGESDILVIEADESDGTVVRYHPEISVLLNISRDHKEEEEVEEMLLTAASQSKSVVFNGEDVRFSTVTGTSFGFGDSNDIFPKSYESSHRGIETVIGGEQFTIPFPGKHTVANTLATVAAVEKCGVTLQQASSALKNYRGIERRFDRYEVNDTVTVIDDYAHNPEKIAAAISAAQEIAPQITAIFQPHGFGPLKFMFDDLVSMFNEVLRCDDRLIILPVFYAGGTVDRSIDSESLCDKVAKANVVVKDEVANSVAETIREDEAVLLLGARDPSLPQLAQEIQKKLKENKPTGDNR